MPVLPKEMRFALRAGRRAGMEGDLAKAGKNFIVLGILIKQQAAVG